MIFARWPQLERRKMWVQVGKIALGMMLFWVLLALALLLSGCDALPQGEKPATWIPSVHVTSAEVLFFDKKGVHQGYFVTNVYIYECNPNMARIEPNGVFTAGKWIERTRLRPDVCKAEQP